MVVPINVPFHCIVLSDWLQSGRSSMSLLRYFQKPATENNVVAGIPETNLPDVATTGLDVSIISSINNSIKIPKKKITRTTYTPTQRALIGRYAAEHGVDNAVSYFEKEFKCLRKGTVSKMKTMYQEELKKRGPQTVVIETLGKKRGRPSILPDAVVQSLEKWIVALRQAGGAVNKHVVYAALHGIISSNPLWSTYLNFVPSRGWLTALYKRLNFSRRRATTSRPPISEAAYKEAAIRFLHLYIK